MEKELKRTCKICGKTKMITSFNVNSDTCQYCEQKKRDKIKEQIDEFGIFNFTPTIIEVNTRARSMGLSYGRYSAIYIYGNKKDPGLKELVKQRLKEWVEARSKMKDDAELNNYIDKQMEAKYI